jgi:hypothetical protein
LLRCKVSPDGAVCQTFFGRNSESSGAKAHQENQRTHT